MQLTIASWGNSLGLRLPKAITKMLGIRHGTTVEALVKENKLIISNPSTLESMSKQINLKSLTKKITLKNMPNLEDDFPTGKEVW